MTGLTVALFDELGWDLAPAYAAATVAWRTRLGRQRAVGASWPSPPQDVLQLEVGYHTTLARWRSRRAMTGS
jgi:hypothetical protein